MAPKPKLDSGQRHCLSEAIKLLKPQSNAESAERKEKLEERINDWRHKGRPRREAKAEDARKELREMKKNARKIIKILDNLNPRARDVLPPSIRNITSATLREFADEVRCAIPNVERPKGGVEPDREKRYLAYMCTKPFERYRQAKPTPKNDFHKFAGYMYGAASEEGKWVGMDSAVKWACRMYEKHGPNVVSVADLETLDATARKIQSAADRERK